MQFSCQNEEINGTLESIHVELSSPVKIDGHVLYISGSFGVSLYPQNGRDLDMLVKMGCDELQGYLYSHLLNHTNLLEFYNK